MVENHGKENNNRWTDTEAEDRGMGYKWNRSGGVLPGTAAEYEIIYLLEEQFRQKEAVSFMPVEVKPQAQMANISSGLVLCQSQQLEQNRYLCYIFDSLPYATTPAGFQYSIFSGGLRSGT